MTFRKICVCLTVLVFTIHYFWYCIFSKPLLVNYVKVVILPLVVFVVVTTSILCCMRLTHKYYKHYFSYYLLLVVIGSIAGHLSGWISQILWTALAFGVERVFLMFRSYNVPHLLEHIWLGGFLTLSTFAGVLYSVLLLPFFRSYGLKLNSKSTIG